jgi:HD-GYP domain-containing protein (c-di-GMP phosphodiesterase class II)
LALSSPNRTEAALQDGETVTQPASVRLSEVLGALSHALDMTEGQPPGHSMRCCWIGVHLGREIGLDDAAIAELYYVLLLKDLGCSSNAARICQLYLVDDRRFKKDFKTVGTSLPQVLGFVLSHTGAQAPLAERLRAVLNVMKNGGEIARDLIETRCTRGADIARQLRFSAAVAEAIQALDEHWDGGGKPAGLAGADIPVFARIALLAQVVDVFHAASGRAEAVREVRTRAGTWFDPMLVAAFERVAAQAAFWAGMQTHDLDARIGALAPTQNAVVADEGYLDDIAAAFARVVDAKSPYTSGHSDRVALYADTIAEELGFDAVRRRQIRRAALLHDIGKLGVSNTILDKPGKLDDAEFASVRQHPVWSEAILSRVPAFSNLARVGGAHHERLDGRGYPRGLTGEAICLDTRIVSVADVFDALTAERPYRAAMPVEVALGIMVRDVGTAFDADCFAALQRGLVRFDRLAEAA